MGRVVAFALLCSACVSLAPKKGQLKYDQQGDCAAGYLCQDKYCQLNYDAGSGDLTTAQIEMGAEDMSAAVVVKVKGDPCAAGDTCATGFCVDGYCCDQKCDNTCMACSVPGYLG